MSIARLRIHHLRNITEAEIDFSSRLNFISGANGSGKSSLLEAVYILGRGRSFRSARFGTVVQNGFKSLELFAETLQETTHRIGVTKTAQSTAVRIDGNNVTKLSDLARITPLQIITPMSHEILERGPEYRRRFVEWGVFHVEHTYFTLSNQYTQALRQRNAQLRSDPDKSHIWDGALGDWGERLNQIREDYVEELRNAFAKKRASLNLPDSVDLAWCPGWDQAYSLAEALRASLRQDIKRGFTLVGPHRADLKITYENRSAFSSISRGQQKMIISALHLAQAEITFKISGLSPVILFDDLVSELDSTNQMLLLDTLECFSGQVFITSSDRMVSTAGEHSVIRIHRGVITQESG